MPTDLPAEIPSAQFTTWFTRAVCATAVRCKLKFEGQPYSAEDACFGYEHPHWEYAWETWSELLADEAAGVGWDPKAANACLAKMYLTDCKHGVDVRTWPTRPCEEAFVGAVKVDQPCDHDAQCKVAFCDRSGVKKEGCPGVCRVWKGEGEICGVGSRCGAGTWCRDGKCAKAPPGGGLTGNGCGVWPCAVGNWCSGSVEEPGKCLPMPQKGEDCAAEVGCAPGLRCNAEAGAGKCVDGIAEDQPCVAGGTPSSHVESCGPGLLCTTTLADYNAGEWTKGKCMKAQDGLDQWCDGVWQCAHTDFFCKPSKDGGYCAKMPGEGQPCESGSAKGECQPGLICPGGSGCKRPAGLGQKCDINQNFCRSPFVCNLGKCARVPKVGQACLTDPKLEKCGPAAQCVGKTCKSTCGG